MKWDVEGGKAHIPQLGEPPQGHRNSPLAPPGRGGEGFSLPPRYP